MARAPHRDWRYVGLVALGGACGSLARVLVGAWTTYLTVPLVAAFPAAADAILWFPLGTLTVNVLGAFALGYLLEALARRGRETVRRRKIRLGIGTGVLGGFTTYSALALDTQSLLFPHGMPWIAVLYVLLTLVGGTAACLGGVALAARVDRTRRRNR
ncbi:fluoride efflux transporter FluC [Promicromonospora citrea]|uniref:Fluoride-specific ion channel FluC n=1 Tax=Promicromonospora citrea TaxID=43677 RepID=A0A8H9GFA7_9MICO|nr:CrcB family protein [Promicromonospora citrea]NNH53681.1 CrcB family protein [Promicromonospora citrea]GGM10602.1 putative fluoride ion transporter CrcB [Promicromonospora citrea]